jgi:heme-degrading monooxygenase HmoA
MFARVSSATVPKEKSDAVTKTIKESVWPAAKKQKGYKGYLNLRNTETGEGMTISLWDTEEDMLASEKTFVPQATKQAAAAGGKETSMKHFEVMIKD